MRQQRPEIVPADRRTRQNLLILFAAYLLLLLWLEPLIDFLLSLDPMAGDPLAMAGLDKKKVLYTSVVFAAVRCIPISLFFWLGYRILTSATIPPARMKFPITVQKIRGKQARMFGIVLMSLCMLLICWEMAQLSRKILNIY